MTALIPLALFVVVALVMYRRDRHRGIDVSNRLTWLVAILLCCGVALLVGQLL